MKALFLVGGLGTRLRPLTNELPKPMVPIMAKPLLERNIANLKKSGITEIVLGTCYKSRQIKDFFGDGSRMEVKITYVYEETPLGTGGAVKNAEGLFDEAFLVFNADILCDIDIGDLIRHHQRKGAIATIAATPVNDPSAYGVIESDENGCIVSFKEKPGLNEVASNLINAGIYVFEPEIFKEIPSGRIVSLEKEVYPSLLANGRRMAVYNKSSYWLDIGTIEKYLQAHYDILEGKYPIGEHDFMTNGRYIGENAKINPEATIRDPVYIGENVEIQSRAVIGPYSVIGEGSRIGAGSRVKRSVLWKNVQVGDDADIVDSVIMADSRIAEKLRIHNTVYFTGQARSAACSV